MKRFSRTQLAIVSPLEGLMVALTLLALCGCQAPRLKATSTAETLATTVPPSQTAAAPSAPFFDGFKMLDARSGWAWKGIGQLYRTDDGGAMWTEIHLQGKMLTAGGFYLDRDQAWLPGVPDASTNQAVYHTADAGKTWSQVASLHGPNLALQFYDAEVGWATNTIGAAGNVLYQIYQTRDGGQTWTQLQPTSGRGAEQGSMPGTIRIASGDTISFMPPNTIWVSSGAGLSKPYAGLSVSRDGGKTWQDVNPVLPPAYLADQPPVTAGAPQFVTDQDAYLAVTAGQRLVVFVSHDSGNTWALLPAILRASQMLPRVQFVSAEVGFAVCGIWLCTSQDAARSWKETQTPFPFSASSGSFVTEFDFVDPNTGWAMLSDRNVPTLFVKTTDGGRTWINVEPRLGF